MDKRTTQLREALAAYGVELEAFTNAVTTRNNLWLATRANDADIGAIMQFLHKLLEPDERTQFLTPASVAAWLMLQMGSLDHEELWVVNLDNKNRILSVETLYRGTVEQAPLRVAEVFRSAIALNATSIIIAHNHPSGDPEPSGDDLNVTRRIVEGGKQLEIKLLDHLIIGHGRWTSLRERHGGTFA